MTLLPKALITTKRSPPNVPSQVFRSRFRVCDLAGLNRPLLQPMRGISRWKKNAPERSVEIDSAATPLLILQPFNAFFFLSLLHDTHIIHICMQYAWFYYVSYLCLSQVDDFGYWWNVVQYVQACQSHGATKEGFDLVEQFLILQAWASKLYFDAISAGGLCRQRCFMVSWVLIDMWYVFIVYRSTCHLSNYKIL